MRIEETRQSNIYNLQAAAKYYNITPDVFTGYYNELLDDVQFLDGINKQITNARDQKKFTKGIFGGGEVNSLDWFAFQRIFLYVILRHLKPSYCLETGVYYGGNTAFILNALHKNGKGQLISIDLPDSKIKSLKQESLSEVRHSRHPFVGDSEFYDNSISPGFIVPSYLTDRWQMIEGSSLDEIPKLDKKFDFYIHDSDHSHDFVVQEMTLAIEKMNENGTLLVDDINWSNAFFKVCVERNYFPLCLTDNGKLNLEVRTGLILLNHPYNKIQSITGSKG